MKVAYGFELCSFSEIYKSNEYQEIFWNVTEISQNNEIDNVIESARSSGLEFLQNLSELF